MSDLPKVPALKVADFDYDLPTSRIAFEAVEPRDASKLLVYGTEPNPTSIPQSPGPESADDLVNRDRADVDVVGEIGPKIGVLDLRFSELLDVLDDGDFLVANDTKVIPARLHGKVVGGGQAVEVFLLNPLNPEWSLWEAMVGNRRKFKDGACLAVGEMDVENGALGDDLGGLLKIEWHDREKNQVRLILPEGFDGFVDVPSPTDYVRVINPAADTGLRSSAPVAVSLRTRKTNANKPVAVVTGSYGATVIRTALAEQNFDDVVVLEVQNKYFGGNTAVAGLMTYEDVYRVLTTDNGSHVYLLPDVCLNDGVFLDGGSLEDLQKQFEIEVLPTSGSSLRDRLESAKREVSHV